MIPTFAEKQMVCGNLLEMNFRKFARSVSSGCADSRAERAHQSGPSSNWTRQFERDSMLFSL